MIIGLAGFFVRLVRLPPAIAHYRAALGHHASWLWTLRFSTTPVAVVYAVML